MTQLYGKTSQLELEPSTHISPDFQNYTPDRVDIWHAYSFYNVDTREIGFYHNVKLMRIISQVSN